jgi:hypothetical protein
MLVVLAMIVAFTVGVLIASRSELFPPQVDRAGQVSPAADASPQRHPIRWRGTIISTTSQRYSAGACITMWRSSVTIATATDSQGAVHGRGRARLVGKPRCPFPMSQPQIRGYEFSIGGRLDPDEGFLLSIDGAEPTSGILDYGGFESIAASRSVLKAAVAGGDRATGRSAFHTRTSLGKIISSRTVVRLRCPEC